MKIYTEKDFPKPEMVDGKAENFSVDVITVHDEMLNIGYYDFVKERWKFHADTLVDPYEFGQVYEFAWMYKPEELKEKKK